jgi:hypothetical protein
MDTRVKPAYDEKGKQQALFPECRGRKQAIANRDATAPRSLKLRDCPDQHEEE